MGRGRKQPSHYFDPEPTSESKPTTVHVDLPDIQFDLTADASVFSNTRLDPGTRFLLERAPVPTHGNILDLGCGYGAIAIACALRSPSSTVHAVDINARARDLTRGNAARLGLHNVHIHDDPSTVPPLLTSIYSNPPIRIGKVPLHDLLMRWLAQLAPDGHAYLVVSKHLGADSLASFLTAQQYPVSRLASHASYRILEIAASQKDTE